MKSFFLLGFFLASHSLLAQTYTTTNVTADSRTGITFNIDLKTGITTTTTVASTSSEVTTFTAPLDTTTYIYPVYSEPTVLLAQ